MRGLRVFFCICYLAVTAVPLLEAQVTQVSKQKLKQIPVYKAPDLILTDFWVSRSGMVKHDEFSFKIPFRVTIKNQGTGDVKDEFYLAIQKYSDSRQQWQGERDTANCQKITRLLKKGETMTHRGLIWLRVYEISDQTVRLRALVDDGCQEFPPQYGNVKELREDNNSSNEQTVSGEYSPTITSISPDECIRGETEVRISGYGIGDEQSGYTVMIRQGEERVPAVIKSWPQSNVFFTVPNSAPLGDCRVSIATKSNLTPISNEVGLRILKRTILKWSRILDAWNLFRESFEIHLHNKGSGCSSHNESYLKLTKQKMLDLPRIKWHVKALGDYIFLVQDMNTTKGGISLTKSGCQDNQIKLIAEFESSGKEIKGYWDHIGAAGCNDTLAPDIQVDNAKITVLFTFGSQGANLHLNQIYADFTASIRASGSTWEKIMNTFKSGWKSTVVNKIKNEVRNALLDGDNKTSILADFENIIRFLSAVGSSKTVVRWEFKNDGIHIIFYE